MQRMTRSHHLDAQQLGVHAVHARELPLHGSATAADLQGVVRPHALGKLLIVGPSSRSSPAQGLMTTLESGSSGQVLHAVKLAQAADGRLPCLSCMLALSRDAATCQT